MSPIYAAPQPIALSSISEAGILRSRFHFSKMTLSDLVHVHSVTGAWQAVDTVRAVVDISLPRFQH